MRFAETAPRGLTGRLLMGVGALLLSVLAGPAFAQAPASEEKKNDPADQNKAVERARFFLNQIGLAAEQPASDADKLKGDLRTLEAELQKKQAEAQLLKAQIEQLHARRRSTERAQAESKVANETLRIWLSASDHKDGEAQEIILRKVDGVWKVIEGKEKKPITLRVSGAPGAGAPPTPHSPPAPPAAPAPRGAGGVRSAPAASPAPPGAEGARPPMGGGFGTPGVAPAGVARFPGGMRPPGAEPDNRIDNLERKLDKMMQLLDQMRKDMEGGRGKKAGGSEEEARRADQEKALTVDRKATQERVKAVQKELERVDSLKRAIEESLRKENPKREPQP